MYLRVAQRLTLRVVIAFTICIALLPLPGISFLISGAAQGQREERKPKPKPGKPEGEFPDLEDIKQESGIEREAAPPIHSTINSPKNAGKPWDGRRVGDPAPNGTERGSAGSGLAVNNNRISERHNRQTRRAHARARMTSPPPPPHDQFVQNFFLYALTRSPYTNETNHWYDQLRAAYANSAASLKAAGIELGRTLFESAEYAARNRDAHGYVYDLYKTYLMRDPDPGGWSMWEGLVPTHGREYVRRGFEESGEFATLSASITTTGSPSSSRLSLISAQTDPRNQPGRGMLSRDANWNVPLLSLPGRNGLDLGLGLSYSSMVWTRSGPYIYFDEDNGFPSPGFRLGFPTLQRKVFDAQTAKNSYLLITPSGRRVELRQEGTSNIYDAADSSYLRLTDNGGTLLVHSTDGTKMSYAEINGEWRCTEIKDRNGNYITVNNNSLGRISTITDTLGRVITFNYDGNSNLISITQAWNGQPSHQWVGFSWTTRTMQYSFSDPNLRGVIGTKNGQVLPVIAQVTLNDTSHFTFDYTNPIQVSAIRNYFGAIERNATLFTYDIPAGDAPRLSDTRVSARNWTGYNNVPSQVITNYSAASDFSWCQMTGPDGTIYKEFYGTGWQKGLTTTSEVWSGGIKQKWTTTAWTQDNTGVSYETNPRITEINIYDASGNRRRTTISYGSYAPWGLPYAVREYAADAVTPIRETIKDYNLSQAYLDRRIIGLVSAIHMTSITSWQLKIDFTYDDPARLQAVPVAAIQHDASYNTSFTARGNATAVSRWDVNDIVNPAKALTTYTNYYNTGTPISTTDPTGDQSSVTYADSFSDNVNRNTFAYPTTFTDADNNSSYVQYNFDFGATTRTQEPTPVDQSYGAIQTMAYNNLGQLERITTTNNSAYKRFWYGAEFTASYATVNNVADEFYSVQYTDGLGRVINAVSNHPGSIGGYRLVNTVYNQMGQVWLQSNPTEVNSSLAPTGEDGAGFYHTQQTYDWQGRPLVTTNTDGTTKVMSYGGCGCAGGQVVTITDEGTLIDFAGTIKKRQQKIYSDVFGRISKVEVLNWDGSGPNGTAPGNSVYATTVNTYNARDQITSIKVYQGSEGGAFQEATYTHDGYGRTKTRHLPGENPGAITTWNYFADDTVQSIVDPRGATSTFGYNNRDLLTSVSYTAPSGIPVPASVSYGYDAAGNRTSMTDAVGTVTYHYNTLSRMDWEQRSFTGLSGTYRLSYNYNLLGSLTSLSEPSQFGRIISYTYDSANQLTAVNGSGPGSMPQYMSGIQYRAFGATKTVNYGSGATLNVSYNARMQASNYAMSPVYKFTFPAGYTTMGTENTYHPDGRIRYARDLQDGTFDRSYFYDRASRLEKVYSGREARGFSPSGVADCPFQQTYSYDVWNNMGRTGHHWATQVADTPSYSNNRRTNSTNWTYDASGNVLTRDYGWKIHGYNAAGQESSYDESGLQSTPTGFFFFQNIINLTYGGDGEIGKRVDTLYTETEEGPGDGGDSTLYYLRSTVLGGAVIASVTTWGAKYEGHVYAGGQKITDMWGLHNVNPVTGAWVSTAFTQGVVAGTRTELDPLGADVGTHNVYETMPSYADLMGGQSLYEERGNPFDLSGGCTLDGIAIPCSDAMRRLRSGIAEQVIPVNYYVTATRNGETVFSGYVGSGYARPGDMLMSESRHQGTLNPDDMRKHASQLGNHSFWVGMLNGSIDFGTSYGETTYSDDVGTHDISSPYNVNIYGGAAFIGNPQSPVTTDNPKELQAKNNGPDCGIVVNFRSGTTHPTAGLPNGPSTIMLNTGPNFGLGFSVSGWVGSGGIGTIGNNKDTMKKVSNPQNPKGRWSLEQWTHSWIGENGQTKIHKTTFPDLPLDAVGLTAADNTFGYYDHPGGPPPSAGFGRYDNYLIKVYSGKIVCEVKFHLIQHGTTIRWGQGLR